MDGSEQAFDLDELRARVRALAERGIYIGTSSWKYQGWLGQIYTRERYAFRGRFAESRFERDCLREYAETFKTVCFDGAYYTWQEEEKLRAMADQVPSDFRFAFKVTETITIKRYPSLPRYRDLGGKVNEHFLEAPLFCDRFLRPLESVQEKVGPIIFEFSKFYPSEYPHGADFLADLDKFFSQLPKEKWKYGVELRNRKWLGPEYLGCLSKHGVSHVFNSWTDMPPVSEQLEIVGNQGEETMAVARFLLKPGRKYEEAVERFQPYTETKDPYDEARATIAQMIDQKWLKPTRSGEYLYINNRLEGNALKTIHAVLKSLNYLVELDRRGRERASLPKPSPPARTDKPQLEFGI